MASYGVAIENRFALLGEESAPAPKAPKPAAEPKQLEKPRTDAKLNKRGGGTGVHNDPERLRGRGRGRMYDRHSGTGRGREVQKDGAGAHNWGSDKQPVDEPASDKWQGQEEEEAAPAPVAPAEGAAPAEKKEGEAPVEEGPKTMSLDAFLKTKQECELDAKLKPRQLEEEDIKGFAPPAEEEEDIIGSKPQVQESQARREKKAKKQVLEVPMFFASEAGERRGRGRGRGRGGFRGGRGGAVEGAEGAPRAEGEFRGRGRGRGRGEFRGRGRGEGRGRGGFRGRGRGRGESAPLNVQDPTSFPELKH